MSRAILLADDSLTIQKVVTLIFEDSDFEVAVVANGDEALTRVAQELPDIVIADIHMPGASGYDVARGVKALSPETPVLLLVGTFEPFDETEVDACGADGYLMKPFEGSELVRRVESMVGAGAAAETPLASATPAPPEALVANGPEQPSEAPVEESRSLPRAAPEPDSRDDTAATVALTPEDVDRIARRVVELMSPDVVREVAAEVVPQLAREVVRQRIEELERDLPGDA